MSKSERAQLKLLTAMKVFFLRKKKNQFICLVTGRALPPHMHNRESHIWTQIEKDAWDYYTSPFPSSTTLKSPSMPLGCYTKGSIYFVVPMCLQPLQSGKPLDKEFLFQHGESSLNENSTRILIISIQITNMQELNLSTTQDICNILNTA